MPKRLASSTTIAVALGTSTPTSITVVATSTSISPLRNASKIAAFSGEGRRPCSNASRSPFSSSARSRSNVSVADATSSFSDSSMSGHTT